MRSLFKLSLAALFVGGLVLLASRAYADEMAKPELKITGDVTSSFGDISFGETSSTNAAAKAYSEFTTGYETN
ncbi:MAG TPA: hypothetical protein VL359_08060, partial [bacterium]|nr:hypothetical protein [bacterium]